MLSSNCSLRRAGTLGSGSRGAAGLPAAALSARACFAAFLSSLPALAACSALRGRDDPSGFLACLSSVSAIDLDSRALGDPHFLAILAFADEFEDDARRLTILGIGKRHIRQVDGRLLGDDAAFLRLGLALVALDHVDPAH